MADSMGTFLAPRLVNCSLTPSFLGLGKTLTMLALIIATLEDKPTEYSNSSLIGTSSFHNDTTLPAI